MSQPISNQLAQALSAKMSAERFSDRVLAAHLDLDKSAVCRARTGKAVKVETFLALCHWAGVVLYRQPENRRGQHFTIAHDGFAGTVIGEYETLEGKRGVVLQLDGAKVVHVYGEKWLNATP